MAFILLMAHGPEAQTLGLSRGLRVITAQDSTLRIRGDRKSVYREEACTWRIRKWDAPEATTGSLAQEANAAQAACLLPKRSAKFDGAT